MRDTDETNNDIDRNHYTDPEVCDLCGDPIWLQEPYYHSDFDNKPVHIDCALKNKYGSHLNEIPYTKEVQFVTGEGSPNIEPIYPEPSVYQMMRDWMQLIESQPRHEPQYFTFTDIYGNVRRGTMTSTSDGVLHDGTTITIIVDKYPEL